ncbi:MAG: acetylxylan esterase [Victivallales bacterium]|nr:acetylxylan esterase [Victivallales bacterium]
MSNFGALIQEFYVKKLRDTFEVRRRRIESLKTAEDAWKFINEIKTRLADCWQLPKEHAPINSRCTGIIDCGAYEIRKMLYDSMKDFPISALLYVPKSINGKTAAILHLSGHSPEGKGSDYMQCVSASLCRKGFVVLAPDPIGQGERKQFPDVDGFYSAAEHSLFNRRLVLLGTTIGTVRLYDAIRSVDMLLSLPYVDSQRIGVTGVSGGGTMTSVLNAVDNRLACIAPACYITRWYRNMENERPVDGEQMPPGAARFGGDMADLLLAAAPRPMLIMGQLDDIFDIRGTREVFEEVKHIYSLLGYPENVEYAEGPTKHSYSIELRVKAYDFMNRRLGMPGDAEEPKDICIHNPSALFCTPNGRTTELPGTRTMNYLIKEHVEKCCARRIKRTPAELRKWLADRTCLGQVDVPYYRQLRSNSDHKNQRAYARYGIESEPGIIATMICANGSYDHIPASLRTELYIPHQNAYEELRHRPLPQNRMVFGLDYRGIGESLPNGCDQNNPSYISYLNFDYCYAAYSQLLGESYLGGRLRDIISAIKLLHANGNPNVTLTAAGQGVTVALLAAFLCDEPVRLDLPNRPMTYKDCALSPLDDFPQSLCVPGILEMTDLDEIWDIMEDESIRQNLTAETH